ncbi:hypothetical protein Tco_0685906 [Tanacetum coccineum]
MGRHRRLQQEKIWALLAKYFKKLYKLQQQPQKHFLQTRETRTVDTLPGYKNDKQTKEFRNKRAVNVVGVGENVVGPECNMSGIQVSLTCRNLVIMLGIAKGQNGLKTYVSSRKRCCTVETAEERCSTSSSAI